MKLLLIFAIFIISSVSNVFAQFNDEAWGARPNALGGAYVGAGSGADAPFWNPAGIASLRHFESSLSYAKPIERLGQKQRHLGSLSAVYGSSSTFGSLGFWWSGENVLDQRRANTAAVTFAKSAYNWRDKFDVSFGINMKYMTNSLLTGTQDTRSDMSTDIGVRFGWDEMVSFGAVLRDANRPQVLDQTGGRLADRVDVGAAYWFDPDTLITADVSSIRKDQQAKVRGGLERWFLSRSFALRAGGNPDFLTGGFAFRTGNLFGFRTHLEYAYQHPFKTDEKDKLHVASLKITFGESERREPTVTGSVPPEKHEKVEEFYSDKDFLAKKFGTSTEKHDFPLGPEDIIEIEVKNHPELNVTVIVDSWGNIKLPYVGTLNVRNQTPELIRKNLEKIYADFFVEPPEVEVLVKEYHSRMVLVLGAVQSPGRYPIGGEPVTLKDILLQAGLPSDRAARWRVFVIRQTEKGPIYKHINVYKILYRGDLRNNIELESGDIVYLPMTLLDAIVHYVGRIIGPLVGVASNATGSAFGFGVNP